MAGGVRSGGGGGRVGDEAEDLVLVLFFGLILSCSRLAFYYGFLLFALSLVTNFLYGLVVWIFFLLLLPFPLS